MTIRILSSDNNVKNRFRSVRKLIVQHIDNSVILEFSYFMDYNTREGYVLKEGESFQVLQEYK